MNPLGSGMNMLRRRTSAMLLLLLLSVTVLPERGYLLIAQQQPRFDNDDVVAEPYSPDEFPRAALDLRRFTIIATGTFPIAMFFGGLLYEFARFGYYSIESGQVRGDYAPLFFGPTTGPRFDKDEQRTVLTVGVSLSLLVAVLDFALGKLESQNPDEGAAGTGTAAN